LQGSISVENKRNCQVLREGRGAYLGFIDGYETRIKTFHVKDTWYRLFRWESGPARYRIERGTGSDIESIAFHDLPI
jgi:hypothetical protein